MPSVLRRETGHSLSYIHTHARARLRHTEEGLSAVPSAFLAVFLCKCLYVEPCTGALKYGNKGSLTDAADG